MSCIVLYSIFFLEPINGIQEKLAKLGFIFFHVREGGRGHGNGRHAGGVLLGTWEHGRVNGRQSNSGRTGRRAKVRANAEHRFVGKERKRRGESLVVVIIVAASNDLHCWNGDLIGQVTFLGQVKK